MSRCENDMASAEDLEIYRQRYETFRHLDKTRWQMLQIAVAVGSLALAFGNSASAGPDRWTWFGAGVVLITLGCVMQKIQSGIRKNGDVLRRIGERIGDVDIPPIASRLKATSFWVSFVVIVIGTISVLLGLFVF